MHSLPSILDPGLRPSLVLHYRGSASECPHHIYAQGEEYVFNSLFGRLVGHRMYSVEFILDYVQLRFDIADADGMPVLICDVRPRVVIGPKAFAPGDAGWCDSLVALVGHDVVATHEAEEAGLAIDLAAGSVVLRPSHHELVGPEIATLNGFADGRWMCWRPGEEAFEHL